MRILACIKQEFDFGNMRDLPDRAGTLDTSELVPIANPADLSALALIRRVFPSDEAVITAACVGPSEVEPILRETLVRGADEAVRIWDEGRDAAYASDPVFAADALADLAAQIEAHIVVCGTRSLMGGSGYVGPAIAERLGYVQVSDAVSVVRGDSDCELVVRRRLDRGRREVDSLKYPAVITVAAGVDDAPYASLPVALAAARASIACMDVGRLATDGFGPRASTGTFEGFARPRMRARRLKPDFSSRPAAEILGCMMGDDGGSRKTRVLSGTSEEVADGLAAFLRERGIDAFGV